MADATHPLLACDAMLGGLARWLRAAGHDASWHDGIDDGDLVRLCHSEGRTVLSSDDDIFGYSLVRDGVVPSLFVPRGEPVQVQLAHVLRELGLPLLPPRCMACGGELAELPREEAAGRVPRRSLAAHDRFLGLRPVRQGVLARDALEGHRGEVGAGGVVTNTMPPGSVRICSMASQIRSLSPQSPYSKEPPPSDAMTSIRATKSGDRSKEA